MDSTSLKALISSKDETVFDPSQVPQAPPDTNRGARKTSERKVLISLDWVTFTVGSEHLTRFMELLGLGEEWTQLPCGAWGYPQAIGRGTTRILYGVRNELCVVCTGTTCCELRERGISDGDLLGQVLEVAKNVSRLDVAFDTFSSILSLEKVRTHFEAGAVVSRFKTWDQRAPRKIGSDRREGWTIVAGNRESRSYLRFYDKGLESGAYPANVWTRAEVEFKKENAHAAARLLFAEGMEAGAGLLANLIDFKELGQVDPNKSRHKQAAWWADFLASAEKIRLGLESPKPSLERAVAWVKRQVGPTLAAIVEALGGETAILHEVLSDGLKRQKAKHRLIANSGFLAATA